LEGGQGKRGRNHIGEKMIIPVRCFTCGKVIASAFEEYKRRVYIDGEDPKNIKRYCCRRKIISHPVFIKDGEVKEYIDEAAQHE
jgi:DNA-directed RNA polymerase subunit N